MPSGGGWSILVHHTYKHGVLQTGNPHTSVHKKKICECFIRCLCAFILIKKLKCATVSIDDKLS